MGDFQFSPYACVLCCNFHTLLRFCWRRGVFIFHLKTLQCWKGCTLDTPAQVLLWRAAPWPVKEAGRRRQQNGRVGWGDSHSVDPQSVTCLKRESGERTHGAKVQEAAWRSLKSETQRREPTVKESHRGVSPQKTLQRFQSSCPFAEHVQNGFLPLEQR